MLEKTKRAEIYVGLNDAKTHKQIFEKEKYISILKNVCHSYHTAFSYDVINGGYFHEDGSYVEETSLKLLILGEDIALVREIAKDVCAFFHQESVMIQSSPAEVCFIHEDI